MAMLLFAIESPVCGSCVACFQELEQWDVGRVTKTYSSGGQRVALRRDNALYFVHTDHLGSSSLLTTETGQEVPGTRLRYHAYGAPRPDAAATHNAFARDYTQATYTGQMRDASTGLLYYGARFFDPALGRFLSPDTIVPSPGNPQSLNRYAYVLNNPLRYTDSTGHCGPLTPLCLGLLLGGMALMIKVENPDYQFTQEDINAQRLGGALFVGGATLAAGGALAGTVGAARVGTTATTAACADGDCTNEVRSAGQVAQNAAKAAESESVFWSGPGAKRAAETWAKANGGTTLEMSALGREVEKATSNLSWEQARPLWEQASRQFAEAASGTVHVFHGNRVRLESIWATIEYQILSKNPAIRIIYHVVLEDGTILEAP